MKMSLSFEISDRSEIGAAIALLQLMHGHTFQTNGEGPVSVVDESLRMPSPGSQGVASAHTAVVVGPGGGIVAADNPATGLPDPAAVFGGVPQFPPPAGPDAAAVFGGNVPGMPAPSTVGVAMQPNAPGALPVGFVPPPNAASPVAPLTAPSGPVLTANAMPQAGNPAPGVELDAEGIPWDDRIHAGTKTKTVKGTWKAKKGLNDEALVNRIKAELKARAAGAVPQPVAAGVPFVPPAAFSPPVQPVAPSAPVGHPTTFEQFMPRITEACLANKLPMEAVQAAVTAYQLPSITALQQNPQYIPHVWQYLQQQYPALV